MNMLVNSVQLIGRLGADVEVKTTNQGSKVANVRFVTNEYSRNAQGDWIETTYWHNLVFWGKLVDKLEKNDKKGTRLIINGSITYREYTDVHNVKREVADIRVQQFMQLGTSQAGEKVIHAVKDDMEDLPF